MNEFSKIAFDIRAYLHTPKPTPSNRGSFVGSVAGRLATTPAVLGLAGVAGTRAYGDYTGHTAPTQFLNDLASDVESAGMSGANAVGASAADLAKNFDLNSAYDTLKRVWHEKTGSLNSINWADLTGVREHSPGSDELIKHLLERYKLNPKDYEIKRTDDAPFSESGYGSPILRQSIGDGTLGYLAIPGNNEFIAKHEMSHATSPLAPITLDNLPAALGGNLSQPPIALAALSAALGNPNSYIRTPDAAGGLSVNRANLVMARKFLTNPKTLAAMGAAYAPRFVEESLTNARALYDQYDEHGASGVIDSLPSAAISEGSYMLPVAMLALAYSKGKVKSAPTLATKAEHVMNILRANTTGEGKLRNIPKLLKEQGRQWAAVV